MKRIIPCVVITLALMLAGNFLPITGFIGLVLCPLPLSILGCIEGHKVMSIAELLVEATLFVIVSPMTAVYFLVGCAPVSAFVFMLSREEFKEAKKYSGSESLLICTGASIVSKLILLLVFWFTTGRNILFPNVAQMQEIFAELYGEQPALQETLNQVLAIFPQLMPSMLVIYSGLEVFLNYSLCGSFVKRFFPSTKAFPPELPEFKMWRFPVSLIFVLVGSSLINYFIEGRDWLSISAFTMNLQIIIDALMFINGLAFTFWLMAGFKLRRTSKLLTCLILSIPFFWPLLMITGMSDIVLNLRERIKFSS